MQGVVLYPLSSLKGKYPAIFAQENEKYVGREGLAQQKIPVLNCSWNDVIFVAPIEPSKVFEAMILAGLSPDPEKLWYKIPINDVKHLPMVWYSYPGTSEGDFGIHAQDVALVDPEKYQELSEVPPNTIEYYEEVAQKGEKPFLFHLIPHMFIKGAVDVSNAEIIRWTAE